MVCGIKSNKGIFYIPINPLGLRWVRIVKNRSNMLNPGIGTENLKFLEVN